MKVWLLILLLLPALAQAQAEPPESSANPAPETLETGRSSNSGMRPVGQPEEVEETGPEFIMDENSIGGWEAAEPETEGIPDYPPEAPPPGEGEPPVNWVDDSHAYATNQAQALTEWMDSFFGDPNYDLEKAESLMRLELVSDWDQDTGQDWKVRLRGKVQLPKISRRLNLVFAGEDSQELDEEERQDEDRIGLQYQVRESERGRFDLTMGFGSGNLRPGVRYRNQGNFSETSSYRFTQRIQYEDGDGFYATTQMENNWVADEDSVIRWSNRAKWGEHTDGVEWRTKLAFRERYGVGTERPLAASYYGSIKGVTSPDAFVKNYRIGSLFRRQIYRDYLFLEVEPALNYRRRYLEEDRHVAWSLVVRLEIALERDLRRIRDRDNQVEG